VHADATNGIAGRSGVVEWSMPRPYGRDSSGYPEPLPA